MTPSRIKRSYRINDTALLARAKCCRLYFEEDKADFVAFSSLFSNPYSANWLALINSAENELTDEARMDELASSVRKTKILMDKAQRHYREMRFFVSRAFPNNIAIKKAFKTSEFHQTRYSPRKTIHFLNQIYLRANEQQAALLAVGYHPEKIDEILEIKKELETAYQKQKQLIAQRSVHSQNRISKYNAIWTICTDVCKAGKRIYHNNYAKRQRYVSHRKTADKKN
ncbi:MAG: hypothetical protein H8D62_00500 [Bacteroidetes bacterium]|nr:hypothetical protein [Bacteroidota bacterium]